MLYAWILKCNTLYRLGLGYSISYSRSVFSLSVNTLLNMKLCETESGKYTSVLALPGSILIVPQATLGGKPKGKGMQYHGNIGKDEGLKLYDSFVSLCQSELSACKNSDTVTEVKHGTYGNRQVLKLDTNGPYTHLMEF